MYLPGVRTMHKAYVTSPGNQRNTLSNVKYGYKECTQTMCNIEAQLESMMGTFNCKLKGKNSLNYSETCDIQIQEKHRNLENLI